MLSRRRLWWLLVLLLLYIEVLVYLVFNLIAHLLQGMLLIVLGLPSLLVEYLVLFASDCCFLLFSDPLSLSLDLLVLSNSLLSCLFQLLSLFRSKLTINLPELTSHLHIFQDLAIEQIVREHSIDIIFLESW